MGRKIVYAALVLLASFSILGFFVIENHSSNTGTGSKMNGTMQLIVVPYFEPTSNLWNVIYDAADKHPGTIRYVIINPCSGPCGPLMSNDWDAVIGTLEGKGIKTLGYIYNTSENYSSINYYMKDPLMRTNGIFFDGEGSSDNAAGFKQYSDYVHRLGGIVYINPGYNYTYVGKYLSTGEADFADIYEIDSNSSHKIGVNKAYSPWKVSMIVGNITNSQEMQQDLSETAGKGIGISYMYSDSYETLPPFFTEEVNQASTLRVSGGNASP